MKIPENAIIPDAKLTRYLLLRRSRDDKSKFLAQAGFSLENPEALLLALRQITLLNDAIEDRSDEFGTYYQVKGVLQGVNGTTLNVITIWLQRKSDRQFQFLTLVPNKETKS